MIYGFIVRLIVVYVRSLELGASSVVPGIETGRVADFRVPLKDSK